MFYFGPARSNGRNYIFNFSYIIRKNQYVIRYSANIKQPVYIRHPDLFGRKHYKVAGDKKYIEVPNMANRQRRDTKN